MDIDLNAFDPDNPPEGMPETLIKMLREMKDASAWSDSTDKVLKDSMKALDQKLETEILIKLWQYIGDHAESYQESFGLAGMFWKVLLNVRKCIKKVNLDHRPSLLRALSDTLATMADMHEASAEASRQHEAAAPPKIRELLRKQQLEDD